MGAASAYTEDVKAKERTRRILHVDLDPFLVSVERSLDPTLRGRPVIVGALPDGSGVVAAASSEARALGVRAGQPIAAARRACPQGVFRPGDLETYARYSEDVTAILQAASRRVERPSADEAYVDLTPEGSDGPSPVGAAEAIKDDIQRRLGLDASLGLASSRLAARVASSWARPRGLLVVLPGYEASFLARQPLHFLPDLPPHLEAALEKAGLQTLGDVHSADRVALEALVGTPVAERLQQAARGEGEEAVALTAPPSAIQEEAILRDRRTDREGLEAILDGLASRACRRRHHRRSAAPRRPGAPYGNGRAGSAGRRDGARRRHRPGRAHPRAGRGRARARRAPGPPAASAPAVHALPAAAGTRPPRLTRAG